LLALEGSGRVAFGIDAGAVIANGARP